MVAEEWSREEAAGDEYDRRAAILSSISTGIGIKTDIYSS